MKHVFNKLFSLFIITCLTCHLANATVTINFVDAEAGSYCYGDVIIIDSINILENNTDDFKDSGDNIILTIVGPAGYDVELLVGNVFDGSDISSSDLAISSLNLSLANANSTDADSVILEFPLIGSNKENDLDSLFLINLKLTPRNNATLGNNLLGFLDDNNNIVTGVNGIFYEPFTGPTIPVINITNIQSHNNASCGLNPVTIDFGSNLSASCLIINNIKKVDYYLIDENTLPELLLSSTSLSQLVTDKISNTDQWLKTRVIFDSDAIYEQDFTIGAIGSGEVIELNDVDEIFFETTVDTVVSAYQSELDLTQYIKDFDVASNGYENGYYYSMFLSNLISTTIVNNSGNTSKTFTMVPIQANLGTNAITVNREHRSSGCISSRDLVITIIPDVVTADEVICYGTDTSIVKVAYGQVSKDNTTFKTTEYKNLKMSYGTQTIELNERNNVGGFYEFKVAPTDIYNFVAGGSNPNSVFIIYELQATTTVKDFSLVEDYTYSCSANGYFSDYYWSCTAPGKIPLSGHEFAPVYSFEDFLRTGFDTARTNHPPPAETYITIDGTSGPTISNHTVNIKRYNTNVVSVFDQTLGTAVSQIVPPKTDGKIQDFDNLYCQNGEDIKLLGNYDVDSFYTPGQNYRDGNNFIFKPTNFPEIDTTIPLTYYYKDDNECSADTTYNVRIYAPPKVEIGFDTVCYGSAVNFKEMGTPRPDTNNIINWTWNFGNGLSVASNNDSIDTIAISKRHGGLTNGLYKEPSHLYDTSGGYTVNLTVESDLGCVNSKDTSVVVGEKPRIDFTYQGKITGNNVLVNNLTLAQDFDTVKSYLWKFRSPYNSIDVDSSLTSQITHVFDTGGVHSVTLVATSNNACIDSTTKNVASFPRIKIDSANTYTQAFESSTQPYGWIASHEYLETSVSGWEYVALPAALSDNTHNTGNIWLTDNPADTLLMNEDGWLESPCFDISELAFPLFSLDLFQSVDAGRDGGVLQYTVDDGATWQRVGDMSSGGDNWFNRGGIITEPGKEGDGVNKGWLGWSDNTKKWITARHALETQRSEANSQSFGCVRFRIAYSSDEYKDNAFLGFAVDNFLIGKRKKVILLEEFINTNFSGAARTDFDKLNDFTDSRPLEVVDIRYHMKNGLDPDPLNYINWHDYSARASEYGAITTGPMSVIDGIIKSQEMDYSRAFEQRSLKDPGYEIFDVETSLNGGSVNIKAKLRKNSNYAQEVYGPHNQLVRVAIVQRNMVVGSETYRNVLLDLLPNGVGNVVKSIPGDFPVGGIESIDVNWDPKVVTIGQDFRVIIYVGGPRNIDEIEQVYFTEIPTAHIPQYSSSVSTGTLSREYAIYPNPASHSLNIVAASDNTKQLSWTIFNVNGGVVKTGNIYPGEMKTTINIQDLTAGLYVVELLQEDGTRLSRKISKLE